MSKTIHEVKRGGCVSFVLFMLTLYVVECLIMRCERGAYNLNRGWLLEGSVQSKMHIACCCLYYVL